MFAFSIILIILMESLIYIYLVVGLLDFSPEEIRLEAYTANAKENADSYVRISDHNCVFCTHNGS